MFKMTSALRERMAQNIRDFIAQQPEAPLFNEYPNPAKEFSVYVTADTVAITHPSIQTVFLTSS